MLDYDPKTSIQRYPMPMGRFGLNPWGETLYRVVLIESRRSIVYGQRNGAGEPVAKWEPTYPHMLLPDMLQKFGSYVLEKWLSAFEFAGCTAEKWNMDPDKLILGPYPARGEYSMIGNTAIKPADINVEKLIGMVEAGTRYSWAERLNACRLASERTESDKKLLIRDIVRDALPVGLPENPMAGYGGGRGTKTAPILKSANELHLPRPTSETQVNGGPRMMTPRQARRFGFPHRKMLVTA